MAKSLWTKALRLVGGLEPATPPSAGESARTGSKGLLALEVATLAFRWLFCISVGEGCDKVTATDICGGGVIADEDTDTGARGPGGMSAEVEAIWR